VQPGRTDQLPVHRVADVEHERQRTVVCRLTVGDLSLPGTVCPRGPRSADGSVEGTDGITPEELRIRPGVTGRADCERSREGSFVTWPSSTSGRGSLLSIGGFPSRIEQGLMRGENGRDPSDDVCPQRATANGTRSRSMTGACDLTMRRRRRWHSLTTRTRWSKSVEDDRGQDVR
jgi:hypothetical protein